MIVAVFAFAAYFVVVDTLVGRGIQQAVRHRLPSNDIKNDKK